MTSSSGLLISLVDEEPSDDWYGSKELKHCIDETDIPLLLVPHVAELKTEHCESLCKMSEIKVLSLYLKKRSNIQTFKTIYLIEVTLL